MEKSRLGERCYLCVCAPACVFIPAIVHSWECGKARWKWTAEDEEEEAWRNMVHIVGLALLCFLSEWFPIPVGLECCSRKRGVVGLCTSPGSGLEHVQIEAKWTRERHIALACVRNKSTARSVLKAGGDRPALTLLLCLIRRKGSSQQSVVGLSESPEAQWWAVRNSKGMYLPGLPQFPRKNLRTWKQRVWPQVSKRLSSDRWECWMKLHNTHPDNQQLGNCWLVCPLSLLVTQGDLHFSGVKAFATKIFVFDFVGVPPPPLQSQSHK